jgi:hypothetical protein
MPQKMGRNRRMKVGTELVTSDVMNKIVNPNLSNNLLKAPSQDRRLRADFAL